MTHCAGKNYTNSNIGLWYKFIHTAAKDDTRCAYCYNKLLSLGKAGTYGMEQYVPKIEGKINCDTYRRELSRMLYNDVIISIMSDNNIPYVRYNKETADMEKHGIYCVEMAHGTKFTISINVKDYLYNYFVKTADSTSSCDAMAFYTNERTLDIMTSNDEPIAITIFKYTKNLSLTSAATILIKTIPSNPVIDAQLMYKSQELLLANKLSRLNEYLANANLLTCNLQPQQSQVEPTATPNTLAATPTATLTTSNTLATTPTATPAATPTATPNTLATTSNTPTTTLETPDDYVEL